jgi:hypothetical protein
VKEAGGGGGGVWGGLEASHVLGQTERTATKQLTKKKLVKLQK